MLQTTEVRNYVTPLTCSARLNPGDLCAFHVIKIILKCTVYGGVECKGNDHCCIAHALGG